MSKPVDKVAPVGVVGAGAMGCGIALVAAAAGHPVLLFDAIPDAATRGVERMTADLAKLVARGKLTESTARERVARIRCVTRIEELAPALLVVEAIVEDLRIKAEVLARIEALVDPAAVIASNTSSLSITSLGATLMRPQQFAGFHFFNPAVVMPLVEVVSGAATSPEVVNTLLATAATWGKTAVHCQSTPGFIVNRIARPFYAEALRLLTERATDCATLDALLRDSGGFRMGPCALMDLIGHDVNFAVTRGVYEGFFQDPRYRPSLLQQELVLAGRLGRKSGQGFFQYGEGASDPAPATAAAEARPSRVVIEGDLGPAAKLAALATAAGIQVEQRSGTGVLRLEGTSLALTDGRTAAERSAIEGPCALFDLALDYATATRIGLAFPDGMSAANRSQAIGFFQALGKNVSVIDDAAGMAVMRTVAMIANEAADALHQGLASATDIDSAMTLGANHPLGPLAWIERAGASRLVHVIDTLSRACPDGRYRTSPLLRRRAAASQPLFHSDTAP